MKWRILQKPIENRWIQKLDFEITLEDQNCERNYLVRATGFIGVQNWWTVARSRWINYVPVDRILKTLDGGKLMWPDFEDRNRNCLGNFRTYDHVRIFQVNRQLSLIFLDPFYSFYSTSFYCIRFLVYFTKNSIIDDWRKNDSLFD